MNVTGSNRASTGGRQGKRWLERGVRLGYAARALLWGIIAITALTLALGSGGETQGSRGALHTLAGQPFGTVLLWAVTVGLASYALWRLIQAITNKEDDLAKSIWMRLYHGVRGLLYGVLALSALRIVTQSGSSGGSNRRSMMSRALELPAGQLVVGAVGLGIVGYGLWQWYRAATRRWEDDLETARMSSIVKSGVHLSGVVGYLARGVLMGVIGGYVTWGAVTHDASTAIGMDGALGRLTSTGYGPWVLAVVAVGVFGFGLFSLAEACYRRIET